MICALAALAGSPARADPFVQNMPHSPIRGPARLLEGMQPAIYTITVRNPNRLYPIVLDFALVTTIPVGGDPTDVINYPSVLAFPATIAAGGLGTFVYSVMDGEGPDGNDYGVTRFSFSTEYSEINGALNTPTIYLGAAGGTLLIQGQASDSIDPTTFNALVGCYYNPVACVNPPANYLYPPSLNNGAPTYGAFASRSVIVVDTPALLLPAALPEPSTWALMMIGVGGLGAVLRRRTVRVV